MGLVDPACDRFDLGKLDFHLPGGPAQSTVPPTQSTVGAAQSTVELTETINMVHRVLFRPPTEYLVWIFARLRRAPKARAGARPFFFTSVAIGVQGD